MEAKAVPQNSPLLLDRMRTKIRVRHYSVRTKESYADRARRFMRYHNKRLPEEMGAEEMRNFLSYLATGCNVSTSTQNQTRVLSKGGKSVVSLLGR